MRTLLTLSLCFVCSMNLFAQEICDNGIDDDADGFIDLNDDDCECTGFATEITDLIPNPSFEERTGCPSSYSEMYRVNNWKHGSEATSDYFNTCDFDTYPGGAPMMPLPGEPDGEGWTGFIAASDGSYMEYIGSDSLESPFLAGVSYTLNLWTAWSSGIIELEFSVFGTPDTTDMPWSGFLCPEGVDGWVLLASQDVTYTFDHDWQEIELTFTPSVDINAIAFGGACEGPGGDLVYSYYYVDELTLFASSHIIDFTETGELCDMDLELTASIDTVGGEWQWYKDGIALGGEVEESLDLDVYGLGDYSALYVLGDNCFRRDYFATDPEGVTANFEYDSNCPEELISFTNTSIYGEDVTPSWHWDFGDGDTSTDENPAHAFATSGIYNVELVVLNDLGCNDTIEIEVIIDAPVIEYTVNHELDGGDGAINLTVTSGVPPYDYDWDIDEADDFDDEEDLVDLEEGIYIISVRDAEGCIASDTITIYNILGVEESSHGGLIKIYPNPASESVTVESAGTYNYVLTAVNGDIVLQGIGEDQKQISLETIAAGTYFLRVESEKGIETVKLVKE